jgi:hypothetical protein
MRPTPTEAKGRLGARAVGSTLIVLLAVSLGCMLAYTRNIGIAEDWQMVRAMTGNEPDLAGWLWSQNNEHRLPVQRLIYLLVLKATGDFRSGMVLNQFMLAALAAAMAATAAELRGRADWRDVVFPLALLHLGHWENLLWGWQIQFVWSTVLAGLILLLLVRDELRTVRDVMAMTLLVCLLAISGANGIALAATMAAFMAWIALWPPPLMQRVRFALACAAATAAATIGLYFVGFVWPTWSPPAADASQTFRSFGLYLGMALGPGALSFPKSAATGVGVLIAAGSGLAAWTVWRGDPSERARSLGLLAFIAASVVLGLAIARGRGALPGGLPARHALFSALCLMAAVYAVLLYAPRAAARTVQSVLVIIFIIITPLNVRAGFEWGDWYRRGMVSIEAAIASGRSADQIAREHYLFLKHWDQDGLAQEIRMLQSAGIGPFARPTGISLP